MDVEKDGVSQTFEIAVMKVRSSQRRMREDYFSHRWPHHLKAKRLHPIACCQTKVVAAHSNGLSQVEEIQVDDRMHQSWWAKHQRTVRVPCC